MITTAPLFPFMSHAAMNRVLELLKSRAGSGPSTRVTEPRRYLVVLDRTVATGAEVASSKAFEVWGRGFIRGYCSAAELQRWSSGAGGVAIQCEAIGLDYQLRDTFNQEST